MIDAPADLRSIDEIRRYIHRLLCEKENLVLNQFKMSESALVRRGRQCGLQFLLHGPRSVRLGAIWTTDQNVIYLYDARGERYQKIRVRHRVLPQSDAA